MADSVSNAPKSSLVSHAPATSGSGASQRRRYRTPSGLQWILPGFVVSVGLIYFCIGYSGYISLLPWNWRPGNPETIQGFASYLRAFNSPLFWTSLQHTLVFFIVAYVVQTTMGIIFAAILHS
ncbi:MAG TPA: hypothetical protein VFC03_00755, partial [Acidimicrobiales bacterium]|nr:hypothetical protein [Acidimicrobiales bacterium]